MTLDEAAVAPQRSPRFRWLTVSLITLLVAAGVLAWEWRHPDNAFEGGYGIETKRPVGHTVWTVLLHPNWPGPDELTIVDLEANIPNDGARVEIEYVVCEHDTAAMASEEITSVGYGLGDRHLERFCARTYPAEGATLRRDPDAPVELLVGVTATQRGRTAIRGMDVAYRAGWQSGRSRVHVDVDLRGT